MYTDAIQTTLRKLHSKKISVQQAYRLFKDLPYTDIGFAKLDTHRSVRRGFPEVIYCEGKSMRQIHKIVEHLKKKGSPLLLTRASADCFCMLRARYPDLQYNEAGRVIFLKKRSRVKKRGCVLVVTGGTGDIPVAEEAKVTLEVMGNRVKALYDVGTAGIHRLLDNKRMLTGASVIIVVAGMEGALASVVSGLVSKPVIAVPTSIGYGSSFQGLAALLTMLNSCSPGISVVNIDNGFGAGYFAGIINR